MNAFKDWMLKRGILFALSQAPIFAVLVGFFFKISKFYYTNFAVMLAFLMLPAWVAYRKKVSTDADEPVHHLGKYALYALIPYAAFSVARIPMMLGFNLPYWHPWYDFGHALTGEPLNEFSSLLPGAFLYSLQGYSLGLGFYILFRVHSLANSMLYLFVFLSSLYCYVFPEYGRIGMPTSSLWHLMAWWAHFWMALTAWYMPIFFEKRWLKASHFAKGLSILAIMTTVISPYAFAFWEASAWQFPRQHTIDQELFNRTNLVTLKSAPRVVTSTKQETNFEFILGFGPRSYKTYINKIRGLDAKNFYVTGELTYQGAFVAWCSAFVNEIDSPNQYDQFAPEYFAKIKALEYTDIPVRCVGPGGPGQSIRDTSLLALHWRVTTTLVGDRESTTKDFNGVKNPENIALARL